MEIHLDERVVGVVDISLQFQYVNAFEVLVLVIWSISWVKEEGKVVLLFCVTQGFEYQI